MIELTTTKISKTILDCLINKSLHNLVRSNITGLRKFGESKKDNADKLFFNCVLSYIDKTEFQDISSLELTTELRNKGIGEGTLTEILSSLDYLREVNADKAPSSGSIDQLKNLFYLGYYYEIDGKSPLEIFEKSRNVEWIDSIADPRFKVEDISSDFDVSEISLMLSPETSIKSSMQIINDSSPNGGYFPNELVTISAAPGTGKTQFMFTEAMNFIRQGKRVLYISLGDMINYTITIRLMCMHYKISPKDAYMDLEKFLNQFREVAEVKDQFKFVCLESGKFTAKEVFNFLQVMAGSYDVFMVDYDGNFAPESDNMYKEGGGAYDLAINVVRSRNKLGIIASQPKIAYWAMEALGKECLAESSRKQQITDTIITFGVNQGAPNRCGYVQIVKGRNRDLAFRVPWVAADSGQLVQIPPDMYEELVTSDKKIKVVLNNHGTIDLPDKYLETNENDIDTGQGES